jgi:predicted membrane-bound dolichyl-phosphate-mannose-protein mannosyltransferase
MRWRPSAWLAWLLWVLIVAFGEAVIIPYQIDWFGLTHPFYLGAEGFIDVLGGPILVFAIAALATVGALVATLRPKNGVGWLCLVLSFLLDLVLLETGISAYGIPSYVLESISSAAWNLTIPPLPVTLMLLIFPDGRLPSRRWWAVVAVALAGYALTFLGVYWPGDEAHTGWPVGFGSRSPRF